VSVAGFFAVVLCLFVGIALPAMAQPISAQCYDEVAGTSDESSRLWNAGLAAFNKKKYERAARFWSRDKKLNPENWLIRAKLIQAYQALGTWGFREAERAELMKLRQSGTVETLSQAKRYCRDQFVVKGKKVLAFEYFELEGEHPIRYAFSVRKKSEDAEESLIMLGSYDEVNAFAVQLGTIKAGERIFHLDSGNKTYAFYIPEPLYDEVRKKVMLVVEGKAKEISKMMK